VIFSQLDAKGKAFTEQERLNKCSKIARNGTLIAAKEATMKIKGNTF
jgi:hypothetical protein